MRGRADGKQVDHHKLAVVAPAPGDEAGVGEPPHGEGLAVVEHPGPVDALVELLRERLDARVGKVGSGSLDAAEQDRRVDGGEFTAAPAASGFDVGEVVEEAVNLGQMVEVPIESGAYPVDDLRVGHVAAMVGDAEGGEAKAGGRDRGHAARVAGAVEVVARAVKHLAGGRMALLPEVEAALADEVVEKGLVVAGDARRLGGGESASGQRCGASR